MSAETQLRLQELSIGYPGADGLKLAVDALSLQLARGQIGCLLGASGCGKTTVLRGIAGFEPLQRGRVILGDRELAGPNAALPAEQRRVGMMFQDYALFPHLDVAANVGFGLRALTAAARRARVQALLEQVGLAALHARFPHELSGGQQQRVALARALAPAPQLLLLDEPFSNLDGDTRQRLAGELRALLKASGTTVLMVTHDQAEAFAMADRIGVMDAGHLRQWDTAAGLYQAPVDAFVAGFIGRGSLLPAALLGLPDGQVLVRPQDLAVDPAAPLRGVLEAVAFRGPDSIGWVRLPGGQRLELDLPAAPAGWGVGSELGLRWRNTAPLWFAP